MFTDRLEKEFSCNEPIFTSEIERVYTGTSHSTLFRKIKESVDYGALKQFYRGVYCLPTQSGACGIKADDVIQKKYLGWGDRVYGAFCGPAVYKLFRMDRRGMPMEIVSNNETSRGRKVELQGVAYFVKKSKCEITKDNVAAYTLVQFLDGLNDDEILSAITLSSIEKYIRKNGISMDQVLEISRHFTARPMRNLITYGIISQIA